MFSPATMESIQAYAYALTDVEENSAVFDALCVVTTVEVC